MLLKTASLHGEYEYPHEELAHLFQIAWYLEGLIPPKTFTN